MAVWLALRVAICSSCRVLATMLPLDGCIGVALWEDTSPPSAEAQSIANCLSEPKELPLKVCIGSASQPRLDSSWCAERSRPCLGVSVEPGGRRTTFGLCCVSATVPVEVVAGADGCARADAGTEAVGGAEVGCGPSPICWLLAGGVTATYAGAPERFHTMLCTNVSPLLFLP